MNRKFYAGGNELEYQRSCKVTEENYDHHQNILLMCVTPNSGAAVAGVERQSARGIKIGSKMNT